MASITLFVSSPVFAFDSIRSIVCPPFETGSPNYAIKIEIYDNIGNGKPANTSVFAILDYTDESGFGTLIRPYLMEKGTFSYEVKNGGIASFTELQLDHRKYSNCVTTTLKTMWVDYDAKSSK